MNHEHRDNADEPFVELISYSKVKSNHRQPKGNIIKSKEIDMSGTCHVEIDDGDDRKPSVILHRTGDHLEQVEFVCSCGKTTVIDFEYEG